MTTPRRSMVLSGTVGLILAACSTGMPVQPDAEALRPCSADGVTCEAAADCCSNNCDLSTSTCVRVPGQCGQAGESCTQGTDCCTFSCLGGACSTAQCTQDGAVCAEDGECCSGTCAAGRCTPLNVECRTSGNPCAGHAECCSGYCVDGLCNATPSYCTQSGDACATDLECCAGMCTKTGGATTGTCAVVPSSGVGGCLTAGEVCGAGAAYDGGALPTCGGECCSRACFPYEATGVTICQPPSGCHPTGELCMEDADCCGSADLPDGFLSMVACEKVGDNPIGRCNAGNSCTPAGGICRTSTDSCNASANCCSGNVNQYDTCRQDSLGIPRCLIGEGSCLDPSIMIGLECSTSADCCGLPCVPNVQEFPAFICGPECVRAGSPCTTTTDCCEPYLCKVPPGSTSGTCGTLGGKIG
jgi:hypothetical protein